MKFNVYLMNQEFDNFDDYIIENRTNLKCLPIAIPQSIDACFYYKESSKKEADHISIFFGEQYKDIASKLFTSTISAILLVKIKLDEIATKYATFAITFGYGHYIIQKEYIQDNFGFITSLNLIKPQNIKKITKVSINSNPKQSMEQISKSSEAYEFGIDIEQDLIQAIVGEAENNYFGKIVSGKVGFSFSKTVNLNQISELLKECYKEYKSGKYTSNFPWIDNIKKLKNENTASILNEILIKKINERDINKIWMAIPDVIEWENTTGIKYKSEKTGKVFHDVDIDEFLDQDFIKDRIELEFLKKTNIYVINTDGKSQKWSAISCIYAEILHEEKIYLLFNNSWYILDSNYCDSILRYFEKVVNESATIDLPDYNHKEENKYNEYVAKSHDFCYYMDCNLIKINERLSPIEFCDLYIVDEKNSQKYFIHNKHYNSSSTLSHLFAQATVSAELFRNSVEFREKLNEKLDGKFKIEDTQKKPDTENIFIVYGIIKKGTKNLDIPFFSKVNFKNAHQKLLNLGYKVIIQKIHHLKVDKINKAS